MFFVSFLIELAQEVDGLQVFASTVLVGNPLAFFAGVIEVEHGSHRIHSQSVNVVLVQPEHCARQQEAADFIAAVVEDVSVPVGMKPFAPVGVLVEMRAVEVREPVAHRKGSATAPNRE